MLVSACAPNPNALGVADFGTVTGNAVDANTKRPLGAFVVTIGGQSLNQSPAANGQFVVSNVPAGTQTITISAIGYQTATVGGVVVRKNEKTDVGTIGLAPTF